MVNPISFYYRTHNVYTRTHHSIHTEEQIQESLLNVYAQELSTSTSMLMLSSNAEKQGPTGVNCAMTISKAEGVEEPSNPAGLLH